MSIESSADPLLAMLAQRAGVLTQWEDAAGRQQYVSDPVLRNLLHALELPCMSHSQISDSMHRLKQESTVVDGDMVVVQACQPVRLRCHARGRWQLQLESGKTMTGLLRQERPGRVELDPVQELGYHTLVLDSMAVTLAVVPERGPCVKRSAEPDVRPWGLVAQIYSLMCESGSESTLPEEHGRAGSGGQHMASGPAWLHGGNFGAVAALATHAAREGAEALVLSPAHAMFSAVPERYSPYSPSSRLFLNVAYADVAGVFGDDLVRQVLSARTNAATMVESAEGVLLDWPRVVRLRMGLLRDLFDYFTQHRPLHLWKKFQSFRQASGGALEHHALYETLHAHHLSVLGARHGWLDWPVSLHDPNGREAVEFGQQHAEEVSFHAFTQWVVHESAQRAQKAAKSAGMSHGLISDVAIGTDPRGSHAWSCQSDILTGVTVGAPPDVYQTQGQNWGLTAFSSRRLRRGAYMTFIQTLRASLRYSGGIRIDHIAGMERLWLIPEGARADEGAYLTYPRDELLGLIALEATRHNALVIGENLGTVSDELNTRLVARGILGTSVLWFEHEARRPSVSVAPFRLASQWPAHAVAMPSTHDLPTIHGWWQERDIQWKVLLGQLTRIQHNSARHERAMQRADLWRALQQQGCISETTAMAPDDTPLKAILSFVAGTPAPMALFSMEDILSVLDQPNMPGEAIRTGLVQHPNWIQRLPKSVESTFADAAVSERIHAVRDARSRK